MKAYQIWSLLFFVSLKYAVFILIASNDGEGSVDSSPPRSSLPRWAKRVVLVIMLLGAGLLLGDGAFTPAVSVLGAVSGLAVAYSGISTHVSFSLLAIPAKRVHSYIVVICVVILVLLFLAQPFGTSRIGVWTHHHAGASYDWYLADHSSPTSAPSVQPCPRLQVCVYAWE